MSTDVDICNLALSHLGDKATVASISPPEGSPQADHCARFFPMARDLLLEMHNWKFATTRIVLASLTTTNPPPEGMWLYSYGVPADLVKVIGVYSPDASNEDEPQRYEMELGEDGTTQLIFTDQEDAVLRYTRRVTDTSRFPPMFVIGLSHILASYIAGPLIKGTEGIKVGQAQMQAGMAYANKAMASDANQQRTNIYKDDMRNQAPWIRGRNVGIRVVDE